VRARIQELLERKKKIIEEAEALAFLEELDARAKSKEWILNDLVELANRCMQVTPVMDRNTGKPMLFTGPDGIERQCVAQYNSRDAAKALELLGKERGMFFDQRLLPRGENDDLKEMSREELEVVIYGRTLAEIEEERRANAPKQLQAPPAADDEERAPAARGGIGRRR
jgi:hypothetical protein